MIRQNVTSLQNCSTNQIMSASTLLLETIKCEGGKAENLKYHQKRFDKSRRSFWGDVEEIDLASLITPPDDTLYRCRLIYAEKIVSIEYIPYTPKEIHRLKVVPSDIEYNYKYADRSEFESLLQAHSDADEIIIQKDGLITDTTISNIALYDGQKWITPSKPLLEGTMRAKLIDEGLLHLEDIPANKISEYEQVALMNAMIGFRIINPVIIHS